MARVATALACQDIRLEYDGKFTLVGVFTRNIGIPAPIIVPQLAFLVDIEGDLEDPLTSLLVQVCLPGVENPISTTIPIQENPIPDAMEGQKRWRYLIPLPMNNVTLHPGRIVIRLIHDQGEIETDAGWVVIGQPPPPGAIISSNAPEPPASQSQPDAPGKG